MGILADIFVAAPDDADSYAELVLDGKPPADRFDYEQFGGFTQLELEILWAMIDGREWNPDDDGLEMAFDPEDEAETTGAGSLPGASSPIIPCSRMDRINSALMHALLWSRIQRSPWPAYAA